MDAVDRNQVLIATFSSSCIHSAVVAAKQSVRVATSLAHSSLEKAQPRHCSLRSRSGSAQGNAVVRQSIHQSRPAYRFQLQSALGVFAPCLLLPLVSLQRSRSSRWPCHHGDSRLPTQVSALSPSLASKSVGVVTSRRRRCLRRDSTASAALGVKHALLIPARRLLQWAHTLTSCRHDEIPASRPPRQVNRVAVNCPQQQPTNKQAPCSRLKLRKHLARKEKEAARSRTACGLSRDLGPARLPANN